MVARTEIVQTKELRFSDIYIYFYNKLEKQENMFKKDVDNWEYYINLLNTRKK